MSELTQCNFCSLKEIKRRAKKEGLRVTKLRNNKYGGIDIFVIPKDIAITPILDSLKQPASLEHKKYFQAWFMKLTSHCVC